MNHHNPANHRNRGFYPANSVLPKDHKYQVVALVLQGGGALGAYQPGVYQGLAEANLHPNWVAGISIGALNAAIIAGNSPNKRVERLFEFWELICQPPLMPASWFSAWDGSVLPDFVLQTMSQWEAWRALTEGQNGFFVPRTHWMSPQATPATLSYYDTSPLKATLERLVDFDRINDSNEMRVSVGAVNIRSGDFVYFDNTQQKLRAEHFMASGALPPGFAAVEIDGEFYWDGGLVSNTPLQQVLGSEPRKNSLVFQVDLWSAKGALPQTIPDLETRQKEIQFSSRTRMVTTAMEKEQRYRSIIRDLLHLVPEEHHNEALYRRAHNLACERLLNVVHLIYENKEYETYNKDYQFGALTMKEHWKAGYQDIKVTLGHKEWFAMPLQENPFVTHDLHRYRRKSKEIEKSSIKRNV